jgi:hypothetical protein
MHLRKASILPNPPPPKHPPGIISTPKIGTPPNEKRVFFDFFDRKKVLARLNAPYKSMWDLYRKAFWFSENFSIFIARGAIWRPFFHFFGKKMFFPKVLFLRIFGVVPFLTIFHTFYTIYTI